MIAHGRDWELLTYSHQSVDGVTEFGVYGKGLFTYRHRRTGQKAELERFEYVDGVGGD